MMAQVPYQLDFGPRRRGDTLWVYITLAADRYGNAIPMSDYTVRATLKYTTDTEADDSSAISVVTSPSSGITVSGATATVMFPASDTSAITGPCTLKYEVQATKTSDTDIVRTLVWGYIPIEDDIVKTSP